MTALSSTAMVLAAGFGKRLRPLTLTKPKPLFDVAGRTMLDAALDRLVEAGVQRVVVNGFYLADQIEAHLKTRHDVELVFLRETEILETGGGVKNALPYFDDRPFLQMNADLPWVDKGTPSLLKLRAAWDAARMDALLLVMPTRAARGFPPTGDYNLTDAGLLVRKDIAPPRSHVILGAQIITPDLYKAEPATHFSNNILWDKAEAAGRLFGLVHQGTCFHVGTPEDLAEARRLWESGAGWAVPQAACP